MPKNFLTIGIPTYRRYRPLDRLIRAILESPYLADARVLVMDDSAMPDESALALMRYAQEPRVRYVVNDINVGYGKNVLRLLQDVETEYMLLMADDDVLLDRNIPSLIEFLERHRPARAAGGFRFAKHAATRVVPKARMIMPEDYFVSSAAASGLVFRATECRRHVTTILDLIESGNEFASLYPQVVLAILLLCEQAPSMYVPHIIAEEGEGLPSGIRDFDGNNYASLSSRIRQLADFDRFLGSMPSSEVRDRIVAAGRFTHLSQCIYADPGIQSRLARQQVRNYFVDMAFSLVPGLTKEGLKKWLGLR